SLFGASLLRQSFDFSDAVAGTNMKFYSAYNTGGVNVDGVPATVADKVDTGKVNWIVNTGNLGTFISLVSVPGIGTQQRLYYYDNANGGTGEGGNVTVDTGDLKSYGDFGIRIDGKNISGQFSFDFSMYYLNALPGSDPVVVGGEFKSLQENPVQVLATQQSNTSAVASPTVDPNSFALYDAYPNPFAPAKEKIRIAFNSGAAKERAELLIYNLVGQEVVRFTSRDAIRSNGRQEIAWNGVDRLGRALPAGVYFYRLQVGKQVAVKKLVLVR
ncbi:T9SS type A sorting domain-containing protein, partial [candidate division KSB1 bacterium]|nr:T9SS type A sorting domain-containing protein [candidate division KSB1 bacterium]